jgi:hypothetical protein
MIFLIGLQILIHIEGRSQARKYYRIFEEMGSDTASNLAHRAFGIIIKKEQSNNNNNYLK